MEFNLGSFISCIIFILIIIQQQCLVSAQYNNMGGELNSPCNSIKDCRYFGYVCRQNTCQCDQWYVPDDDRRTCVGGVEQRCLYDEHCIKGAFCMNQSTCKCKHSSSQVLENGLVCAGGNDLKQNRLLRLTYLAIGIIISVFVRICT